MDWDSTLSDPRGSLLRTLGPDFDFMVEYLECVDRFNLYGLEFDPLGTKRVMVGDGKTRFSFEGCIFCMLDRFKMCGLVRLILSRGT